MNITSEDLEIYRKVLDREVCSKCRKGGYENSCQVGAQGICPLNLYLKNIVEAVVSTPKSGRAADYLPKIRQLVCAQCENQDEHGACGSRDQAACGLDSFIVLVIQAIESTHERLQLAARRKQEAGRAH